MGKKVIILDSDKELLKKLQGKIGDEISNCNLLYSSTIDRVIEVIRSTEEIPVLISDYKFIYDENSTLKDTLKEFSPETIKIVTLEKENFPHIIDALNSGELFKILVKPFEIETLLTFIENALEDYQLLKSKNNLMVEKDKLQSLLDAVPCTISWVSSDLKYLNVNQQLAALFQKDVKDFIGKYVGFLESAPSEKDTGLPFVEFILEFFKGTSMYSTKEVPIHLKTGEKRIYYLIASKHNNGKNAYIVGLDITKLKELEDELRENNINMAIIFQSLNDGVIVLDRENNVSLMNILTLDLLELHPESKTLNIKDLFVGCKGNIEDIYNKLTSDNINLYSTGVEVEVDTTPPRFLKVTKTALPHIYRDKMQTILVVKDITTDKESERVKNEFISNLSHELRTPMNAILGISKMLKNKKSDNLNYQQLHGLSLIHESGDRLLNLINDLLDLSKIEAGKMDVTLRPMSINKLSDNFYKLINAIIDKKDIDFSIDISPHCPNSILADANKVYQVLNNLIGNAVKFTDDGEVSLKIITHDKNLHFIVKDSGIGISEKNLPHIFDRFRQIDGTMSRKFQGTGLGLSLSKKLTNLMGGEIRVDSKLGEGTEVEFYIPLKIPDETVDYSENKLISKVSKKSSSIGIEKNRASILVVEDEEIGRETLAIILGNKYKLFFAENGKTAIKKFKNILPDVILMDIMMPDLDGYETFSRIKALPEGKDIPIIAVTARAMKTEKEKILNHGFAEYVSKPIDDEKLFSSIEKFIKKPLADEVL